MRAAIVFTMGGCSRMMRSLGYIYLWDSSIARISFPRILSFGPDALSGQPDRARWFATIPIGSALISMDRVARYQIEQGHFRATG
jgi:hypothetical protein